MSDNTPSPWNPNVAGFIAEAQRQEQLRQDQLRQDQLRQQLGGHPEPMTRFHVPPAPPVLDENRLTRQKTKASIKVRLAGVGLWLVGVLILSGVYGALTKPHQHSGSGIAVVVDLSFFFITFAAIAWVRWMGRRQ